MKKSNKGIRSQMHRKHPISKAGRLLRSNLGANCLTAEINQAGATGVRAVWEAKAAAEDFNNCLEMTFGRQ